ncbi:hypothetical protein TNCV_1865551 [Trichonephila clavipes]|nr:hypothetical protein TNCV_1865551 [Trichonephila clavipes]
MFDCALDPASLLKKFLSAPMPSVVGVRHWQRTVDRNLIKASQKRICGRGSRVVWVSDCGLLCHRCPGWNPGVPHSGVQRVNPEFRVGSNFRIIPEQYFSGMENVAEFLENIDNNILRDTHTTGLCIFKGSSHRTGTRLV